MFRSPLLFALLAAVLFSTGGLFIKLATLNGLELSSARSLTAFCALVVLTRLMPKRRRMATGDAPISDIPTSDAPASDAPAKISGSLRTTMLAAAAYAATLLLFVQATKWTTAANAIFLQYTAPVYMLVLEPWMYKERYRGRDFAVVVVCLAGMSLFFVGQLRPDDVRGNLAALGSGLTFAIFSLLLRRNQVAPNTAGGGGDGNSGNNSGGANLSAIIYGNLLLGVACAPWLLPRVVEQGLSLNDALIVLYLGTIQIGVAYLFYTLAIARGARSLDVGIVGYAEAVLNPLLVLSIYGERPGSAAVAGGAIIISAVVIHTLYGARRTAMNKRVPIDDI